MPKDSQGLPPHLAFVQIHSLVHRFNSTDGLEPKAELALEALELMDRYKSIHPSCDRLCLFIRAQHHPLAMKYNEAWTTSMENASQEELFMGDEFIGQAEKKRFFEKFAPQFQRLYIGGDFANLQNLLNKVSLLVQFMIQCSDLTQFTENRYFEYLFYQIVAILYGLLWFPLLANNEEHTQQSDEVPSLKWAQIASKCDSYREKHVDLLDYLDDKHPEVIEKAHTEFRFCRLVKWLCAFAKFKEHRLTEFCEDFELLLEDIEVLKIINLQSEALTCYGVASIAAKPFKELDLRLNEDILEMYTSNLSVEAALYEIMQGLSRARFSTVKEKWLPQFLARVDTCISYAVPVKTKGTFWDFLQSVIDLKAFILILSVSECIQRSKMLDKLGYSGAPESTRSAVSNALVMLISVLNLGEQNTFFHQTEDAFYNLPLSDETRKMYLLDKLEDLDHAANTEAAAAHMKTLMIRKHFV